MTEIKNLHGYSGTVHVAATDPTNDTAYYVGEYYTSGHGEGVPELSKAEQSRCVTYHYAATHDDAMLAAEKDLRA